MTDENVIRITIPGNPVAQGRGKVGRWRSKDGREGVTVRDPEKSRNWKGYASDLIGEAMGTTKPWSGPVGISLTFVWPCPRSRWRKKVPVPRQWRVSSGRDDFDNLAKAVADAAAGIVYIDDGQIVEAHIYKIQAEQGAGGRVEAEFRKLPNELPWV